MKLLLMTFLNIFATDPLPVISEKLRLYQNVTGIDDLQLTNIFQQSFEGKFIIYKRQ